MSTTMTYTSTLEVTECAHCHMKFAIPVNLDKRLRRSHDRFYCPLGHRLSYPQESDIEQAQRLKRSEQEARRYAEAAASAARDQLDATRRSLAATKGVTTRLKRRIAAGSCPCCHRTFQNVARHIAGQHPEFVAFVNTPEPGAEERA